MEVCQRAYLSTLGIFDLSVASPDLYLKIGISIGLNKPTLIIAGQGMASAIPLVLEQANAWLYTPPLKPELDLRRAASRILDRASQSHPGNRPGFPSKDYCVFCGQPCPGWAPNPLTAAASFCLIATQARLEHFTRGHPHGLELTDLAPIYLTQFKARTMPLLCETRLGVIASGFTMLDVSDHVYAGTIRRLGLASARAGLLLVTRSLLACPPFLHQASYINTPRAGFAAAFRPFLVKLSYSNRSATKQGGDDPPGASFLAAIAGLVSHFKFGVSRAMKERCNYCSSKRDNSSSAVT